MINLRTYHFNEGPVVTGLCPNGEYGAYRENEDEGRVRGYGHSRLAAIADLNEAIGRDEPEEIDHQALAWDHARDLRKNGEAA
ncbi:MAG: hypothetical protein JWR80_10025 [Bradyrhizobium sp.]|nr:hypothetical protein [Bradyrhizobium sp.]